MKNSRSRSGGSSVGVLKKFLGWESTKGEITEERPLLLELELISRIAGSKCFAKARMCLFQRTWGEEELEKITRLEPMLCKYGTDCRRLTTLERNGFRTLGEDVIVRETNQSDSRSTCA